MSYEETQTDPEDEIGAEGGDDKHTLPAAPSDDDSSEMGDTDQHSSSDA